VTVTHDELAPYIRGQVLIEDFDNRLLHRGEIRSFALDNDRLILEFTWLVLASGFSFQGKKRWKQDPDTSYPLINIGSYKMVDIGPGHMGGDSRMVLLSADTCKTVVFYPINGDKFDPTRLKGFNLETRISP